jgi:hypothetical protein
MLCLNCKKKRKYCWSLTPREFGNLLGEEKDAFRVDDCFCVSCVELSVSYLDNVLLVLENITLNQHKRMSLFATVNRMKLIILTG